MKNLQNALLGASALIAASSTALAGISQQSCNNDVIQLQTTN